MIARIAAVVLCMGLAIGCRSPGGHAARRATPRSPPPRGPASMTPHNEMIALGPYGPGTSACTVMLYRWDPQHPGCRYQLNHCAQDDRTGAVTCLSLADERSVACGASGDACGSSVRCECPSGEAPIVGDPPDVVVIAPSADGGAWTNGARCAARVARLAGTGDSPDEPCEIAVRDCDDRACDDRWVTVSCGARSEVCGRPVRCECASSSR